MLLLAVEYSRTPWFAGWGTLALVNAGLAQGKNRSGANWFVASIFFGPLATLALVGFCEKLPDEGA
jgi:hypothetical protein